MHILIAPNAFKNSLTAVDAANAICLGLQESKLDAMLTCFPIGDGGDGTASLIVKNFDGFFNDARAQDPLARIINTSVGFVDKGKTAVIEMANISGLKLLKPNELDPMHASSFGCGELIRLALNRDVKKIILCIGGSATIDGGSGALRALGARFMDHYGNELIDLPDNLVDLVSVDLSGIDKRIFDTELIVLCDVANFLLGEKGAATVFGPQKGASPRDIIFLEQALAKWRQISFRQTGIEMSTIRFGGAAGGISAALHTYLKAQLVQGIEYFLDITGFNAALENANLVITGEGSIDLQTLEGKGPYGVARRAGKKNIKVIGLTGSLPAKAQKELDDYFDVLIPINQPGEDLTSSILHTEENLYKASLEIGHMISQGTGLRIQKNG